MVRPIPIGLSRTATKRKLRSLISPPPFFPATEGTTVVGMHSVIR